MTLRVSPPLHATFDMYLTKNSTSVSVDHGKTAKSLHEFRKTNGHGPMKNLSTFESCAKGEIYSGEEPRAVIKLFVTTTQGRVGFKIYCAAHAEAAGNHFPSPIAAKHRVAECTTTASLPTPHGPHKTCVLLS